MAEMMDYVKLHDVKTIAQLVLYAKESRYDDWYPLLHKQSHSGYLMDMYIKSCRRKYLQSRQRGGDNGRARQTI